MNAAGAQASANRFFVQVGRSGVDQAVACGDGIDNAALALDRVGDLKDAETGDWHADAVVERDVVHVGMGG